MSFNSILKEDLFCAYFNARKNKRNTKAQIKFEINLEDNLMKLSRELNNRTYQPQPSECFIVNHPVKREIFASQFRDRVVHHLLYNYIAPIFEKIFINDSYSCRKGKGTLFGVKRIEHHIRSCSDNYTKTAYVLKLDIQGYFMNINKQRLYEIITEKLDGYWRKYDVDSETPACAPDFINYLIQSIIFKDPTFNCTIKGSITDWQGLPPTKSLFHSPKGIGLPIGDLTSQLFSNIYLGVFDDYVKRELKIKHYGRYVDDFFVIHNSKQFLRNLIFDFDKYLFNNLGLRLHPKKIYLQHYTRGVHFLGAFIKPYRKYAVNRSIKQFRSVVVQTNKNCAVQNLPQNSLDNIRAILNSYCGYLKGFKAKGIVLNSLNDSNILSHFMFCKDYSVVVPCEKYKNRKIEKWTITNNIKKILDG